jgi:hypothetical protein
MHLCLIIRLVRCEIYSNENLEAINGMEGDLQRDDAGGVDEVAYFPGASDLRIFEGNKGLKLCSRGVSVGT